MSQYLRFLLSELRAISRWSEVLFWKVVCLVKGIKPSPQSEHATQLLKKMAKEGKVMTLVPFTLRNWRLFKTSVREQMRAEKKQKKRLS